MKNSLALLWKRLLAFALDYIVISAYLVVLVLVSVCSPAPLLPQVPRALRRPQLRRDYRVSAAGRARSSLLCSLRVVALAGDLGQARA